MKRMFLTIILTTFLFGGSTLAFSRGFSFHQTKSAVSKHQTETDKKEAKEKRMEAKKEADQKRREAKLTAKNSNKSTKKKHKKFLGIF